MQPELKEVMKNNHFHADLGKEALQTLKTKSASDKNLSMMCYLCVNENMSNQNHKLQLNTNGTNSRSIPTQIRCLTS